MQQGVAKNYLGAWLVKENIIKPEQLQEALQIQSTSKDKKLIGKILVQLNYCTENDVARIMAKRDRVPFISLENYNSDMNALATLAPEAAKRYNALPIGFDNDGRLLVAMKEPRNIMVLDDLRVLTGYEIQPVIAPDGELEVAIEQYFRNSSNFDENEETDTMPELETTGDDGAERPAVQLVNMILAQAVSAKASDIHIEPYEKYLRVRFRLDGVLHDMMQPPKRMHLSLVSRIKVMAGMDIANRQTPQDGRMTFRLDGRVIDVRAASLPGSYGERLTLRLLDRSNEIITLEELGIAPDILKRYRKAIQLPYGFVLVTGPTGSGKSTTLYASLLDLDRDQRNVITVEDPVEYRLDRVNQIQINPKAGLTFATGLRSILRNDPDIIMVGEVRDKETARIAVESAMTGHMVFSTLHTNDAAGTISRLGEMEIEPFLTTSSLVCVLAQRLARLLCPHCKEAYTATRAQVVNIPGFPLERGEETFNLYRPVGCMRCSNTGYRGRIGIFEFLPMTSEIQRLTIANRSAAEIKQAAIAEGMITLRQDGLRKVKEGFTSLEEVLRVVL
ncbi:GspE/PulE family protein [Heliophilum fasciatum]|uniref:Type IV pilus assembly protein PilB n=1 Tax=Heliophilum fasciatum TaxID=35700 RepID=A0A4R2RKE1_9FIRM|nr:ATPase, T2SS/T4P/T4SS family [Heliophilum fasciatum]MCW2278641.1 type IV pilus assembly protein PilB [Heliophilum fasciatum]TCP62657.1 type IV pilus assembly protein PilB [Heliophilum fasciatum]